MVMAFDSSEQRLGHEFAKCQSCCNRVSIFGFVDKETGWRGDCSECNIRWYRAQIMNSSRSMRAALRAEVMFGLNEDASRVVLQFSNLDRSFHRRGLDFERQLGMASTLLTPAFSTGILVTDGFPRFRFDYCYRPLSLLADAELCEGYKRVLLRGKPRRDYVNVLEAVAAFLVQPRMEHPKGRVAVVQSRDYVRTEWYRSYNPDTGETELVNCSTEEVLDIDTLMCDWTRYEYKGRSWWLEKTRILFPWDRYPQLLPARWFWAP